MCSTNYFFHLLMSYNPSPQLVCASRVRFIRPGVQSEILDQSSTSGAPSIVAIFAEPINRLRERARRRFRPLDLRGEVTGFFFITSDVRTQAQHLLMRLPQRRLNLRSLTILRCLQRRQAVSRNIGNRVSTK